MGISSSANAAILKIDMDGTSTEINFLNFQSQDISLKSEICYDAILSFTEYIDLRFLKKE